MSVLLAGVHTQRYTTDGDRMSTHHRKCRSNGGSNAPRNLSKVPQKKHRAYHLLFGNSDARAIAAILNETWIDPDFRLVAIRVKDK